MRKFYTEVMGFNILLDMDSYIEFSSDNVRFVLTTHNVMSQATDHESYNKKPIGQRVELAFLVNTPDEVDTRYKELVEKGATPIKQPENMPWNQRAAFFADPDGNIHELFAELSTA